MQGAQKNSLGEKFRAEMPPGFSMRDAHDWCKRNGVESLSQGMIEFAPPARLRETAAALVAGEDHHTYRARRGEADFIGALAHMLDKVYHTKVPESAILATSGVTGGIVAALQMARRKGATKFALTTPYYTYHARQIQSATLTSPLFVPTDANFDIDLAALEVQLKDGLGCLLISNPGNPSGRVFSKEFYDKLVRLTGQYGCYLILDEIYADLVWSKPFYSPVQDALHPHVLACRGFSKNVACQSWRLGYMISDPGTINAVLETHDPTYISLSILQHGMAVFLRDHLDEYVDHIAKANAAMQRNLALLSKTLSEKLGWVYIPPEGSMYALFRHNEASDVDAVAKGIEKGVGVAAGSMFFEGTPARSGYIRIHVGLDEARVQALCSAMK